MPSSAVQAFVGAGYGQGRGSIGARTQITPLRGQSWERGLLVIRLREGSPAETAGLILGDVIVEVGGVPVEDQETLPGAIMRLTPGDTVKLSVLRGGVPTHVSVTPKFKDGDESDDA